jgi:hypothetical protein
VAAALVDGTCLNGTAGGCLCHHKSECDSELECCGCARVLFLSAISDDFYDVYSDAYYDTGTHEPRWLPTGCSGKS